MKANNLVIGLKSDANINITEINSDRDVERAALLKNMHYTSKEILDLAINNYKFALELINNQMMLMELSKTEQYELLLIICKHDPQHFHETINLKNIQLLINSIANNSIHFTAACLKHKDICHAFLLVCLDKLKLLAKNDRFTLIYEVPQTFQLFYNNRSDNLSIENAIALRAHLGEQNEQMIETYITLNGSDELKEQYQYFLRLEQKSKQNTLSKDDINNSIAYFGFSILQFAQYLPYDDEKFISRLPFYRSAILKLYGPAKLMAVLTSLPELEHELLPCILSWLSLDSNGFEDKRNKGPDQEAHRDLLLLLQKIWIKPTIFTELVKKIKIARIASPIDKQYVEYILSYNDITVKEGNTGSFFIDSLNQQKEFALECCKNNPVLVAALFTSPNAEQLHESINHILITMHFFSTEQRAAFKETIKELLNRMSKYFAKDAESINFEDFQQLVETIGYKPQLLNLKTHDINVCKALLNYANNLPQTVLSDAKPFLENLIVLVLEQGKALAVNVFDGINNDYILKLVKNFIGEDEKLNWHYLYKLIEKNPNFVQSFLTGCYFEQLEKKHSLPIIQGHLIDNLYYADSSNNKLIINMHHKYLAQTNEEQRQTVFEEIEQLASDLSNKIDLSKSDYGAYLLIRKHPLVQKRCDGYKDLTQYLKVDIEKFSKLAFDGYQKLVGLIETAGIDTNTLEMVMQELTAFPSIQRLLATHYLNDTQIKSSQDSVKFLEAILHSTQNISLEKAFIFVAIEYLKKNHPSISGAQLVGIAETHGAKILPTMKDLGLIPHLNQAKISHKLLFASYENNAAMAPEQIIASSLQYLQKLLLNEPEDRLLECPDAEQLYHRLLLIPDTHRDSTIKALVMCYPDSQNLFLWLINGAIIDNCLGDLFIKLLKERSHNLPRLYPFCKNIDIAKLIQGHIRSGNLTVNDLPIELSCILSEVCASQEIKYLIQLAMQAEATTTLEVFYKASLIDKPGAFLSRHLLESNDESLKLLIKQAVTFSESNRDPIRLSYFLANLTLEEQRALIQHLVQKDKAVLPNISNVLHTHLAQDELPLARVTITLCNKFDADNGLSFLIQNKQLSLGDLHYFSNELIEQLVNFSMAKQFIGLNLKDLPLIYSCLPSDWPQQRRMLVSALRLKGDITLEQIQALSPLQFNVLEILYQQGKAVCQYSERWSQIWKDEYLINIEDKILLAVKTKQAQLEGQKATLFCQAGTEKALVFAKAYKTLCNNVKASIIENLGSYSNNNPLKFRNDLRAKLTGTLADLASNRTINKARNQFAAYFKYLLGVLVATSTLGLIYISTRCTNYFSETSSALLADELQDIAKTVDIRPGN